MYKYANLVQVNTSYARHMKRLSNRIFGEVTRTTNSKSMKVVTLFSEKPMQKRSEVIHYYPEHIKINDLMRYLRNYGLFKDEHQDFKEQQDRKRELRGKKKWIAPPYRK